MTAVAVSCVLNKLYTCPRPNSLLKKRAKSNLQIRSTSMRDRDGGERDGPYADHIQSLLSVDAGEVVRQDRKKERKESKVKSTNKTHSHERQRPGEGGLPTHHRKPLLSTDVGELFRRTEGRKEKVLTTPMSICSAVREGAARVCERNHSRGSRTISRRIIQTLGGRVCLKTLPDFMPSFYRSLLWSHEGSSVFDLTQNPSR